MFWLKVVRILASPRGRNFSVASPLLKEAGGLSPAFDRSPPPERPFSVKTGGAGGVYATIFVNGSCPEGQGPGDASTPAELPERRTIGKGLRVQTRDYTYAPRLCQARAAPSPPAAKISAPRARFLLKSVPGKATKRRTRK